MDGLLTFCSVEGSHVTLQFVQCLHVLVLFYTVEDDTSTGLKIRNPILEGHGADGSVMRLQDGLEVEREAVPEGELARR